MVFKFNNIDIKAIYSTTPVNELKFSELSSHFEINRINKITKLTGINSVRVSSENTTASDLCIFSATKLLDELDIERKSIGGVIFVSQTSDYKLPQTSNIIQYKLGLPNDIVCFDLPLGCSGYINGLLQASMILNSSSCQNVLVLAGDTTTKMINPLDGANRFVFGDAGSATLLTKGSNSIGFKIYNDGSGFKDLIISAGGSRLPLTKLTKTVESDGEGNFRSKEDLNMNGLNVFNFAITSVPRILKEIIELSPFNEKDVDAFLLHQANAFIINSIRKKMQISNDKMPIEIDGYGNTGPSSIPLLLGLLNSKSNNLANKKNSILCGFGVGLSWGACYLNLENTIIRKTENNG